MLRAMQGPRDQTAGAPGAGLRYVALDWMRLALAMGIVFGHAGFLKDVHVPTYAAVSNGIGRIVVPFFLVSTGYFFQTVLARGITDWSARVLRLYLFWTAIFLPLVILLGEFSMAKLGFYLVTGYAHLWFLPALLGAGVLLWLVRDWPGPRLLRMAAGFFIAGIAVQYSLNYIVGFENLTHRNAWIVLSRNFLFFGFPYMAMGYLMRRDGMFLHWPPARLWAVFLAGVALIALEVWFNYGQLILAGYFDLIVGAFVATPVLVAILVRVPMAPGIVWLGPLSAAIYFVHPLFVYPLEHWAGIEPLLRAPLSLALSIVAAYALLQINRILPVI